MIAPSRSELSLAPTLGYLALAVIAGVFVVDGNLHALSGRLLAPRQAALVTTVIAGGAGPQQALEEPELGERDAVGNNDDDSSTEPGEPPASHELAAAPEAAAGAATPQPLLIESCIEGSHASCKQRSLDSFRAALAKARAGSLGRPLRLSMFGDSVVATDEIPGRLRQRMTAELGDGGPGFVFAQPPHRFCAHAAITRSSQGTWNTYAVSSTGVRDRLYGFGGSTAQTAGGGFGARIKGEPVTRVAVHYLSAPRGGALSVLGDDPSTPLATIETREAQATARVAQVAVPGGAQRVSVRSDGAMRLFGVVLERDSGAVVDNLGIVSVTAKNFVRNDRAHWAEQVGARAPDLVLVMIGANEAQWLTGGANEMAEYTEQFTAALAPIRKGKAACLVVSPLDQVEVREAAIVSRKVAARMAEAQHAAAAAAGCAFFDTLRWMGGSGSAARWRRRGWLGGDYIHLTRKGSDKLGDALFAELFGSAAPGGARP